MAETVFLRPLAEFDSYRENELEDLMLKSKCFILVQNYHTAQLKLQQLKTELSQQDFQLHKVPAVSFHKTQSLFFQQAGWLPVATNNWVAHSTAEVTWSALEKLIPIFQKYETAFLFCQKEIIISDINRFNNFRHYLPQSFSFRHLLAPNAFFLARLALVEKLIFLLQKKKNEF